MDYQLNAMKGAYKMNLCNADIQSILGFNPIVLTFVLFFGIVVFVGLLALGIYLTTCASLSIEYYKYTRCPKMRRDSILYSCGALAWILSILFLIAYLMIACSTQGIYR